MTGSKRLPTTLVLIFVALGAFSSCSSDDSSPSQGSLFPDPPKDAAVSETSDMDSNAGSETGTQDSAGDGGGDGAGDGEVETDSGVLGCGPAKVWGEPSPVASLSAVGNPSFAGVTPDELTLIWIDDDGHIHIVDRESISESFEESEVLTLPLDYDANHGVALGSDGLTLIVTQGNHKGFAEIKRSKRGSPFQLPPDDTSFHMLNLVAQTLIASEWIGAPVMSSDGETFWYVIYGEGSYSFVRESVMENGEWTAGTSIQFDDKFDSSTPVRLLTGASSDGKVLFFWEEATSNGVVATRLGNEWLQVGKLPGWRGVQPNGDCSRLYFGQEVSGVWGIFYVDEK